MPFRSTLFPPLACGQWDNVLGTIGTTLFERPIEANAYVPRVTPDNSAVDFQTIELETKSELCWRRNGAAHSYVSPIRRYVVNGAGESYRTIVAHDLGTSQYAIARQMAAVSVHVHLKMARKPRQQCQGFLET